MVTNVHPLWNLRFDVLQKEVNPLHLIFFFVLSSEKKTLSIALLSNISDTVACLLFILLQLAPRKLSGALCILFLTLFVSFCPSRIYFAPLYIFWPDLGLFPLLSISLHLCNECHECSL